MAFLETPSRVWRRIEEVEGRDMPSLPSLPAFEDSNAALSSSDASEEIDFNNISGPVHSTPTVSNHTVNSTIRPASSTSSTAKFASSLASRSSKSALDNSRRASAGKPQLDSFDASIIPSLPNLSHHRSGLHEVESDESDDANVIMRDSYPPPKDDHDLEDFSLSDALQSVSRSGSPSPYDIPAKEQTPRKDYDYSISLRSEPKVSPFDKFKNVQFRKPLARTRTPSLTRTTPSPMSSPANSTPQSSRSYPLPRADTVSPPPGTLIPLPRSTTASPAVVLQRPDESEVEELIRQHDRSLIESAGQSDHSMDISSAEPHPPGESEDEHLPPVEEMTSENRSSGRPSAAGSEFESQGDRDPTFSSDDAPTPYARDRQRRSPTPQSSPPSLVFTPTPAIPPRPRARFAVSEQTQPADDGSNTSGEDAHQGSPEEEVDDDPVTPHARRRSFLLSVINSTTRPRLRYPTPHARRIDTPSHTITTGQTISTPGPSVNFQRAFVGVTPRVPPRAGRASHPLSQIHTVSPASSKSSVTSSSSAAVSAVKVQNPIPVTPSHSPYDGTHDRASFISTASSHDLTTYHRANTSFDPVMGLGAQGTGLGRFNAGKLNSYLHGLNRRLQEENEMLVARLRRDDEEKANGVAGGVEAKRTEGVVSGGSGRRASIAASSLGDVAEDLSGEGWMVEKAELEDAIEVLRAESVRFSEERDEAVKAFEEEKEERTRDKERWKSRMAEVEKGVEGIVLDLDKRMGEAEKRAKDAEIAKEDLEREMVRRLGDVEVERQGAIERAEKAERALASGKELGGELREVNGKLADALAEGRSANAKVKEMEVEVMRFERRVEELESAVEEERTSSRKLEGELKAKTNELLDLEDNLNALEGEKQKVAGELHRMTSYVSELEEDAGAAVGRIEALEEELRSAKADIESFNVALDEANANSDQLESEVRKANLVVGQVEEALSVAEDRIAADEDLVAELKGRLSTLERERGKERERSASPQNLSAKVTGPSDSEIAALEDELDGANKEIARLTTLLGQSPARKAIDKAKDTKIEMLEKEKEELLERVKMLRSTVNEIGTPNRFVNNSGISPAHRQVLAMSIRAPKTPGGPLRDMSWLQSPSDPSVAPLVAEISRLQRELDRANDSIDDKLDKLEDAGLGVVGLTRKLEDARTRMVALEEEVARLSRRETRRLRRLEKARCQKCLVKVNLKSLLNTSTVEDDSLFDATQDSIPSNPQTPPTKTSEALRSELRNLNETLATMQKRWDAEKGKLLSEKALLENAANELNVQVRNAREEAVRFNAADRAGRKAKAGVQEELETAKRSIDELEAALAAERTNLRGLAAEKEHALREKNDVLRQLQRAESDMNGVKRHLTRIKSENAELETELRANANADQRARLLEDRVSENSETIEQLRQERSLLATEHKALQQRFAEVSEIANKLRDKHAASQTSHDNRRHDLDLHLGEIEDLRRALSTQSDELHRAEQEKTRLAAEKTDVARTVATLEGDLRRVKRDAEALGRDLKMLRAEKERTEMTQKEEQLKVERSKKQAQTQIRLLNEQLDSQREKYAKAKEELKSHVCEVDGAQLVALKLQHNKECKGLIVQIRYLKAKFTRESAMRDSLAYQKGYLLTILSLLEKSERKIVAAIARIGYPLQPPRPTRKPRTLKAVTLCVLFAIRARRASERWREQTASKPAIASALQEVRRNR